MGSYLEFNDTLQITTEQGFPPELDLERHLKKPFSADIFTGRVFDFFNKPNMRIYHPAPVRVFFVHNLDGKWLHWGKVQVLEQTIHARTQTTSGKYQIVQLYEPEYMKMKNMIDVEEDKRYWDQRVDELYKRCRP